MSGVDRRDPNPGGFGREKVPTSKLLLQYCLRCTHCVNWLFLRFADCMKTILLPQWTRYDLRVFWILFLQVLGSDVFLMTVVKIFQVYYANTNFLLLLTIGSVLPFARAMWNLWTFIPCPPMASVISNVTLFFSLVVLITLGLGTYGNNAWQIFVFICTVWPWLAMMSMVSRLYIERNVNKNPFSPVRELPFLGLLSAFAQVLTMLAMKKLFITDCCVLMFLDCILAALVSSVFLGKARRKLHCRQVKVYLMLIGLTLLYLFAENGPGELQVQSPSIQHFYFIAARLLVVCRSLFIKWRYADFNYTTIPLQPPEDAHLFYNIDDPKKHRFDTFPGPVLHVLDVIWDSGLRDSDFHGMGPLGTLDLHMLTEFSYLLPVSAVMTWMNERDTLKFGFLPPAHFENVFTTAEQTFGSGSSVANAAVAIVMEKVKTGELVGSGLLVVAFCFSRLLCPWSTSRSLFDRASPPSSWKYLPIVMMIPFFIIDVLWLNELLSKFQMIIVMLAAGQLAHHRATLWNLFRRKWLLISTQQLQYHHPSALRSLQKVTMLEFLHNTSVEDYGNLLLETAIHHGNNIREIVRDTRVAVWDPAPTASAAWKLAFSLVTKSLKKQKAIRKFEMKRKEIVLEFCKELVIDLAYRAVDLAEGHGGRMALASGLADIVSKRRALRKLHKLARSRRILRTQRAKGQLSSVPATLATANGTIRQIRDMTSLSSTGKLPPLRSQTAGPAAIRQLSLTESPPQDLVPISPTAGATTNGSFTSVPGQALADLALSESRPASPEAGAVGDGIARGVWAMATEGSPISGIVIAFGNERCGQLGVNPADVDKQRSKASVTVVEEMRGTEPAQIEAGGGSSFVLTAKGSLWAFGSNRAMELGLRKEVTQINTPQRVKSMRSHQIVQIASSSSASGQEHSLALTAKGEVYTFGMSSSGALGQGPDVRETAPLILRLTTEVRIKYVAAGARHSLMLTDNGQLYSIGCNRCGQLGTEVEDSNKKLIKSSDVPVPVGGLLRTQHVARMAVGDDHNLVVCEDGRIFSWGANSNGQLGIRSMKDQHKPQQLREPQNVAVTSLACGSRHSLLVVNDGTQVWGFGSNTQGQLGLGPNPASEGLQRPLPALCHALSNRPNMTICQIAAASSHSLAVSRSGEVFAFGDNSWGQLGFPPEGSRDERSLNASQRPAPSAFGATSSSFQLTAQYNSRKTSEIDQPRAYAEGVGRLWVPTRIASLSLFKVRAVATADTHTLALAL
mmetsp:Transcript_60170/g.105416  ORF Transcript_60170/g.105416 Transcript_60170/m.105416 type:complete len:1243 (-) Transcript_60170:111-3839(-)